MIPREIWGRIADGLPIGDLLHVRLVCKAACQGVDDACESLNLWDNKHLFGEVNPTKAEITKLFVKLPCLRWLDLYWYDRKDFVTAAACVLRLAVERGKDAVVLDAYVHYRNSTIHFPRSSLERLMDFIRATDGFVFLETEVQLCDWPQLTQDLPALVLNEGTLRY